MNKRPTDSAHSPFLPPPHFGRPKKKKLARRKKEKRKEKGKKKIKAGELLNWVKMGKQTVSYGHITKGKREAPNIGAGGGRRYAGGGG